MRLQARKAMKPFEGCGMSRFIVGLLVGLMAGVPLWLPITIGEAWLIQEVLHLPGNMSAKANFGVGGGLYAIWFLAISLVVLSAQKRPWFIYGFICSLPLPTILINYLWQSSGII